MKILFMLVCIDPLAPYIRILLHIPVTCIWNEIPLTLLVIQQLAALPKSSKIRGKTKWLSLNHLEPARLISSSPD